jgi:tRNA dimethylallyltransferase
VDRPLKLTALDPLVVVLLGPTASGKTALALSIARRFHGEIVNCDSVAMYREFEIGTAKPTTAERAEIPHHLLDCADPRSEVTAGEYARQARQILSEIDLRKNLPIVSGGTGLYLRALLEGLFAAPQPDNLRNGLLRNEALRNKLRARAQKFGPERVHRILRRLDAEAAARIHANDLPKVIRAIEVCLAARKASFKTMTELWQQGRDPLRGFRILRLGLNPERELLYARINQRAANMFDERKLYERGLDENRTVGGLIAETETLLAKYGSQARPLASLGYKQAAQFLRGELNRAAAIAAAQQAHRNYAKRQITWFRREPDVRWLEGFGDDPVIQAEALAAVEQQI